MPRSFGPKATILSFLGAFCLSTFAACGASEKQSTMPRFGEASVIARDPNLDDRERCQTPKRRVETIDLNGDGVPNIYHAFEGDRRVCSEFDLNFDGKTDIVRFYDVDQVRPIREEYDYDFDGLVDEVLIYEDGLLVRKELDTNFDHKIDTWLLCHQGRVLIAERDRRLMGRPDVFERYENGVLTEARYDDDLDGVIDRIETYRDGRIVEIAIDRDGDGTMDERTPIRAEDAGPPLEPILCEATEVEESAPRGPEREEPQDGAADDEDAEETEQE